MSNKKTLLLTLSREPFEVMVTGEKMIEYRNPSKWILSRLVNKDYDCIKFVNGYGKNRPYFIAAYKGWAIETSSYPVKFSNGFVVNLTTGMVKIFVGEIVKVENSAKIS